MTPPPGALQLAATPLSPPQDGKTWAFHLVNGSTEAIDAVLLESVDYEWGDIGNGSTPNLRFGPIAPGAALELWRDDDDAADVRTSLTVRVRIGGDDRRITAEFGKLSRGKAAVRIPALNREGILATATEIPLPRLRAWHLSPGYLVDRGPTRTSVIHALAEQLPEGAWRDLHDYAKVDDEGKSVREYPVSTWSVDDELSVSAYAVIARELRERTLRTFTGDARPDLQTETAALTGLREVEDRKTLDFLEKALSAENQRADDHAALLRREGEARVAAIPGAQDDPGLGKDYLRAQELLRHRVASYGDPLAAQLLRALGRFGALGGAPGGATDAFVAACRHAAFDPTIKATKTKLKASAGNPAELRELSETLEPLRRSLLEHADGQERADATANATAYRQAADLVARARDLLITPA